MPGFPSPFDVFFADEVMLTLLTLHEGHGHGAPGDGETLWHYLIEAEHWPLTLGTAVALVVIVTLAVLMVRLVIKKQRESHRPAEASRVQNPSAGNHTPHRVTR